MEGNRRQQKARTRKMILDTARQVYTRQGFSATTAEIAKEAGVSHGTIFVHFSSREALLMAVVEEFGAELGTRMHELSQGGSSVDSLLAAHLDVLASYESFYTRLVAERSLLPEAAYHSFAYLQSTAAYHFGSVMERAIGAGKVKPIPVHLLFNTWLGLLHYYLQHKELFSPEGPLLERYGPELTAAFTALIAM